MPDIQDRGDIRLFVVEFYNKARIDPQLGSVFAAAVEDDHWDQHFEQVTDFWESALFGAVSYRGGVFDKHANLPIDKRHFDQWLSLFEKSIRESFDGPVAEDCIKRAITMGQMFESKLTYLRANPQMRNIH